MYRVVLSVFAGVLMLAAPALAADPADPPAAPPPVVLTMHNQRPAALPVLYAGFTVLNVFDTYSTLHAINQGAREASPLLAGVASDKPVFIAVKAAVTAAPIIAAEALWRDHHHLGAVMAMVAANGFMTWVAVHNASVIQQQSR